ncbi:Uncharacterised protein [Streptococcus pneumoniae]|nr:Uncharacterised protein [Streptococcus pneumoniae]
MVLGLHHFLYLSSPFQSRPASPALGLPQAFVPETFELPARIQIFQHQAEDPESQIDGSLLESWNCICFLAQPLLYPFWF